uniref:Uncharacterized protein n=1 Tax=uncultured marine group II/III euryarchaeote KM3_149_F06 TaxID=1457885 RepID=A0A075GIW2_9EURY|nr:hypothetical protein [uncultured marine group II/III euryarchaeote KM3_149_F06]
MSGKISLNFSGKSIELEVKKTNLFSKFFGLMFRSSETENLLFDFARDCKIRIHSLFVFFPFLIIWLNEENKVVGHEIVRPFRFSVSSKKRFKKFVEVPINRKNQRILDFFDDN